MIGYAVVGSNDVEKAARFYEPLGPAMFWMLHVGLCLASTVLILALAPWIRGRMAALDGQPSRHSDDLEEAVVH